MEEVYFTTPREFSSLGAGGCCLTVGKVLTSTFRSSRLWLLQCADFTKSRKAGVCWWTMGLLGISFLKKLREIWNAKNPCVLFFFWKKPIILIFFLNVPLVPKENVMHYLNNLSLLLECSSYVLGKMLIFWFLLFCMSNLSIYIFLNFYKKILYIFF